MNEYYVEVYISAFMYQRLTLRLLSTGIHKPSSTSLLSMIENTLGRILSSEDLLSSEGGLISALFLGSSLAAKPLGLPHCQNDW